LLQVTVGVWTQPGLEATIPVSLFRVFRHHQKAFKGHRTSLQISKKLFQIFYLQDFHQFSKYSLNMYCVLTELAFVEQLKERYDTVLILHRGNKR
jgi:hypothetical protein